MLSRRQSTGDVSDKHAYDGGGGVCRHACKAIATHTAAGYPVAAALCGLRTHQRHQIAALSPDTIKNVAMLCHVMLFVCLLERVWPLGAWHCRVLHANLRRNRVSGDILRLVWPQHILKAGQFSQHQLSVG